MNFNQNHKTYSLLILVCLCFIITPASSQQVQSHPDFSGIQKNKFLPGRPAAINKPSLYKEIFKLGITFNRFSVEATFYHNKGIFSNDSFVATGISQYYIRKASGISVSGIPLQAEFIFRESDPSFSDPLPRNWYKISFDIEKYKEQWKKLAAKMSPEDLSAYGKQYKELGNNFKDNLKTYYRGKAEDKLRNSLDSLTGTVNPVELAGKTQEELTSLFFGQDIKSLLLRAREKLNELDQLTMLKEEKDSLANQLKSRIQELEAKEKYITQLTSMIKLAQSAGTIDSMKGLLNKATAEYRRLLDNPEELAHRLAEKYHLAGIEKIVTFLSQFKLGGQSVPFAEQMATPFLSKGLSFEVNIKDKFIGFSAGRLFPVMSNLRFSPYDSLMNQNNNLSDKPSYWHLDYRKGKLAENHKGVKLTSVKNEGSTINQLQPADFVKRNTLLINLYSRERIFGNNWLNAEISKSVSIRPNQSVFDIATGTILEKKQNYLNLNNLSLKLKTEGTIEEIGLFHQAYFNKIIGTYANITSNYLATNGYEAGFSLRMKQRNKRLSSYLKGSFRNYATPGFTDSRWKSSNMRIRMMYKLKKGQYLQLGSNWHDGYKTYLLSAVPKIIRQQSRGTTADAMLVNKRIFGLYNTSCISIGLQNDFFPLTGVPGKDKIISRAVTLLLNQTFLYRDHLLQLNVNYTNVSQDIDALLYNTRLDADMGGTFKLNKNLTAGLSAVYGYLKGAYTNAGVRVSLSGMLFKRMELDINSDIRKNITLLNPLFSQCFTMNCGIKYTIKK